MDLKLLVESLALPADSTEAQVLEHLRALKKAAGDSTVWKARAEENLSKLEKGQALVKENAELKADIYFAKMKAAFKITAAEEKALKGMYLASEDGKAAVEELIAARGEQEYLTRVQSLQNTKEVPSDPYAEVQGRAAELRAKEAGLSEAEAQSRVLKGDPELQARYNARYTPGSPGSGGAR